MNSVLGNTERTAVYVSEAKRLKMTVHSPNVNVSTYYHHLSDDGDVFFGLGSIKGVGEQPIEQLVLERKSHGEFKSMFDFFNRIKGLDINKRVVEMFIKSGALDGLDDNRSKLLGVYEEILDKMQVSARHASAGQVGLFQTLDEDFYTDILNQESFAELDQLELLRMEREAIGEFLSAHPLDNYASVWREGIPLDQLGDSFDKEVVTIVGMLMNVNHRMTKTNRPFSIGELEDFGRRVSVLAFDSPKYEEIKAHLRDDIIVRITGKVKVRSNEVSIMVETVEPISNRLAKKICHVDLIEGQALEQLHDIKQACLLNRGQIPIYFHIHEQIVEVGKSFWIKDEAIPLIESILGEQKVWIET